MADKDEYNDEYQFADLDTVNTDPIDDGQNLNDATTVVDEQKYSSTNNVKRNAVIVVVVLLLAMLLYKFLGSHFSEKKLAQTDVAMTPPPPVATPQPSPEIQPAQTPAPQVVTEVNPSEPRLDQKLSLLEMNQQTMRTDVVAVSNQLSGLTTNINALSAQINQLNQTIAALNAKVDMQSHEIERLTIIKKPKPAPQVIRKTAPLPRYYIQAVIPGRAWLIAPNGATLTVREGTSIPGYGVVKLIDPNQGRILTSSGQVIRFSQEDS